MGFIHYDIVITPPNPIDDLTNNQLIAIGNEYIADNNVDEAFATLVVDPDFVGVDEADLKVYINWIFSALDRLQQYAIRIMHETDPPTGETELVAALEGIDDYYLNWFNTTKFNWVVARMIDYSKSDGSGDWAYYSANV